MWVGEKAELIGCMCGLQTLGDRWEGYLQHIGQWLSCKCLIKICFNEQSREAGTIISLLHVRTLKAEKVK